MNLSQVVCVCKSGYDERSMKLRCLFILFVLQAAVSALAGQEIDLEAAIDMALRQNRSLKLAAITLESREIALENTRTAFAMNIQPSGEWSRTGDGDRLGYGVNASRKNTWGTLAELDGTGEARSYDTAADYHRNGVRVRLTQSLLQQFGPLINREPVTAAESRMMAAWRELELRKVDMVIRVVEMYEELFLFEKQVAFNEQALVRLEKLLRLTQGRERQGRASRVDVLRVDLQYGEAQSRLNQSRERLASLRAEFADLLGFGPDQVFVPLSADIPEVDELEADSAFAVAMYNRLDFAQVMQDCEDAARGVAIARKNLLPDLKAIASFERFGEGDNFSESRSLDKDAWFVGFTVAPADILRRNERAALRQAVLNEATAQETKVILNFALQRQVQQAIAAYERARADMPLAERNYRLAESRAVLARRLFEMGKGDNFSVTDAEDGLLQAQNRMLAAQSDAMITSYRLLRTLGVLLECPEILKPRAEMISKGL